MVEAGLGEEWEQKSLACGFPQKIQNLGGGQPAKLLPALAESSTGKAKGLGPSKTGLAEVPYSLDFSEPCAELIRCTSFLLVCLEVIAKADPGLAQQGIAAACAAPAPRLPLLGDGGRASC